MTDQTIRVASPNRAKNRAATMSPRCLDGVDVSTPRTAGRTPRTAVQGCATLLCHCATLPVPLCHCATAALGAEKRSPVQHRTAQPIARLDLFACARPYPHWIYVGVCHSEHQSGTGGTPPGLQANIGSSERRSERSGRSIGNRITCPPRQARQRRRSKHCRRRRRSLGLWLVAIGFVIFGRPRRAR
jgi:hypothetical protein